MTPSSTSTSSSMDDDGEGSQTKGEDARLWPHATVLLLLDVFRNKGHLLQLPTMKKDDVWKRIAAEMKNYGYNYSGNTCMKKWNNLKSRYKIICDSKKATGGVMTSRAYLGVMADLLDDDLFDDDLFVIAPVVISLLSGVIVNTPEGSNAATATTAPTLTPTSPVTSTPKISLLAPSATSTSQKRASEVDGEDGSKKKRRQDPPWWYTEPSQWMRESYERMHRTLEQFAVAVEERNKILRERNKILREKNNILREFLEKL